MPVVVHWHGEVKTVIAYSAVRSEYNGGGRAPDWVAVNQRLDLQRSSEVVGIACPSGEAHPVCGSLDPVQVADGAVSSRRVNRWNT